MMRTMGILLATFALLCFAVDHPRASDRLKAYEWIGKEAPELAEGDWINSGPLTLASQRGKVILLEFWTYGCINCRNTLPFVKKWHAAYSGDDFRIIGVHTPEFESEKHLENVKRRTAELEIEYAVVTDNDYVTWRLYHQRYWPVIYLIDRKGIIRYVHIGEGAYDTTEEIIRQLLDE